MAGFLEVIQSDVGDWEIPRKALTYEDLAGLGPQKRSESLGKFPKAFNRERCERGPEESVSPLRYFAHVTLFVIRSGMS